MSEQEAKKVFEEYKQSVVSHAEYNGRWRKGQTYFNICWFTFPEIGKALDGTEYDCFYKDDRIPAFLEKVYELLLQSN